jgi:hypothetical protein
MVFSRANIKVVVASWSLLQARILCTFRSSWEDSRVEARPVSVSAFRFVAEGRVGAVQKAKGK